MPVVDVWLSVQLWLMGQNVENLVSRYVSPMNN